MTLFRMMKIALRGAAYAAAMMFAASAAQAVTINGLVPANGVEYIFFTHNGGDLTIEVNGVTLADPMIRVVIDDGSPVGALTGNIVATNDDGGPGLNSLLTGTNVAANNYILAIGAYFLSTTEVRSGVASTPDTDGTFQAIFTGNVTVPSIPVPPALPLLVGGAGALILMRRRRAA